MTITLEQWLQIAEYPHTEKRGERIAVCTDGLLIAVVGRLHELSDYVVWAVCGPYTELAKIETERDRKNRLARERRLARKSSNQGSKTDRLEAYGWHN